MLEKLLLNEYKHYYFVGIGGSGMCGLAEMLLEYNMNVSGSDITESSNTIRLKKLGANIFIGHDKSNMDVCPEILIISDAISDDNPEVKIAKNKNIPMALRATLLSSVADNYSKSIGVIGSHGKTTTTSLLGTVLDHAKLDPTIYVGAEFGSGRCSQIGNSDYLVAEVDESTKNFTKFNAKNIIITNLEQDHLENYSNDFNVLKKLLTEFLNKIPSNGILVACIDCPNVRKIIKDVKCKIITYGVSKQADYYITNINQIKRNTTFEINYLNNIVPITINLPGKHNALNALAAFIFADHLQINLDCITAGLATFAGVARRFQIHGAFKHNNNDVILMDDYGHHPTEIAATLNAVKGVWPDREIILLFQPHRYSRTENLYTDFIQVLSTVQQLFLLDVYSAGETNTTKVDSQSLSHDISALGLNKVGYISKVQNCSQILLRDISANCVIIAQGAGSIGIIAKELAKKFQVKKYI